MKELHTPKNTTMKEKEKEKVKKKKKTIKTKTKKQKQENENVGSPAIGRVRSNYGLENG